MSITDTTKQPDNILASITPVILAGGKGERLRPLTSSKRPKPFLRLLSRHNLLQKTVLRLRNCATPAIVCAQPFVKKIHKDVQALDVTPYFIVGEPDNRNTAASVAMAAFNIPSEDLMLVTPSDHVMSQHDEFMKQIEMAASAALDNKLILFGVPPDSNATRYGYILAEGYGKNTIKKVQHFVEKPEKPRAIQIRAAGNCFWNTGIFLCKAGVFLEKLKRHAPEIYEACERAVRKGHQQDRFFTPHQDSFFRCPAISVDLAVMEKARNLYVIDLKSRWADIGTWPSFLHAFISMRE